MKLFSLLSIAALMVGAIQVPLAAVTPALMTETTLAVSLEIEGRTPPRPGSGRRDIL